MENPFTLDSYTDTRWRHFLACLTRLAIITALGLILTTAHAEIMLRDNLGQTVTLAAPAQRIVSLSPAATELIFAAGAGARLIAVDTYSDYPETVQKLPKIGGYAGLDRERLLQLQPDLVIAWASGNKVTDLRWLQKTGVPVYHYEPENLDAIALNLIDIGILAGSLAAAKIAAQQYRKALANSCIRNTDNSPIPVFYKIWTKPLMTIGGLHWLNDVLQRVGMNNIFADQKRTTLTVEAEAALANPYQFAIVTPYLWDSSASHQPKEIRGNLLLDRPSPRIIQGIEQLCQQLHGASL